MTQDIKLWPFHYPENWCFFTLNHNTGCSSLLLTRDNRTPEVRRKNSISEVVRGVIRTIFTFFSSLQQNLLSKFSFITFDVGNLKLYWLTLHNKITLKLSVSPGD